MITLDEIQAQLDGIAAACARHHGIDGVWFFWHPCAPDVIADSAFAGISEASREAMGTAHRCVLEFFAGIDEGEETLAVLKWTGDSSRASNHHTLAAFSQFRGVFSSV